MCWSVGEGEGRRGEVLGKGLEKCFEVWGKGRGRGCGEVLGEV